MESRTRGDAGLKGAFGSRASSHNKGVQRHEGLRDRRRRGIEGEGCCGIKEGAGTSRGRREIEGAGVSKVPE